MCGIGGIVRFDGQPVDSRAIAGMIEALAHRGRDGCGVVTGSGGTLSATADVALGHRRLSIIDLSDAASQPMKNADGSVWVSLNGEIYNYVELREELKATGRQFRTQSDTEVILAAYERWGDECVARLNGMFAFALWDERRRRMLCARDHLGIKPFYFYQTNRFVAFASESRALKEFHGNMLDSDALASYLLGMYVPADWSVFAGVRKLLPAHLMIIEPSGRMQQRRYWRVSRFEDHEDSRARRVELEATMKRAITRQLRSDVPIGALLSGGIDSALVVALAAEQGASLRTYSVGYEGLGVNELPMAAAVAKRYGTLHRDRVITADESVDLLEVTLGRISEPIADSAIVPSYVLSEMAAADGVKVLLSGAGGDEVFGGYQRYVGINARRRALSLTPEIMRKLAGHLLPAASKLGARLRNTHLDLFFSTGGDFRLATSIRQSQESVRQLLDCLTAALPVPPTPDAPLLYRQMLFDMSVYLPDEILLLFDQMSMAHTIEGRVPLIDVDVVEAAFRFPASAHASSRGTKLLLRDLASSYLGVEHTRLRKQGFGGPVPWWVRKHERRFRETALSAAEIPGMEAAAMVLERLGRDTGPPDDVDAEALFLLYCLVIWHRSLR